MRGTNVAVQSPTYAATADFNGDGKLDLAVIGANAQSNPAIYILLGNDDGTFQSSVEYPVSITSYFSPLTIATGDFNGDGKSDLIAGSSVLLGNGDGTFLDGPSLPANVTAVVAGDFNKDGKLDIAGLEDEGAYLLVMLGNGDGTFQALSPIDLGPGGVDGYAGIWLVTTDFDGDGQLDLAVAVSPAPTEIGQIDIFRGNGDGTFQAPTQCSARIPAYFAAVDFNKDGKQDLAITDFGMGFPG